MISLFFGWLVIGVMSSFLNGNMGGRLSPCSIPGTDVTNNITQECKQFEREIFLEKLDRRLTQFVHVVVVYFVITIFQIMFAKKRRRATFIELTLVLFLVIVFVISSSAIRSGYAEPLIIQYIDIIKSLI